MATKHVSDVRDLIIRKLNEHSYQPIELFKQLQTFEVSESALKDALAELLEAELIELSPDRHVRLRETSQGNVLRPAK